mmetsp:Transcript_72773/g.210695  ORF Transcript_72773/g.210695 Transcript_72773/m.210695 type:complete len:201 (-) Transcript_72773:301-903(-)
MDGQALRDVGEHAGCRGRRWRGAAAHSLAGADPLGAERHAQAARGSTGAGLVVDGMRSRADGTCRAHPLPGVVEAEHERRLQLASADYRKLAGSSGQLGAAHRRRRGARAVRHAVRREGEAYRGPHREVIHPLGAVRECHGRQRCRRTVGDPADALRSRAGLGTGRRRQRPSDESCGIGQLLVARPRFDDLHRPLHLAVA